MKLQETDAQVNYRVGALLSASDTEVNLLGYGVYLGDQPIPGAEESFESFWTALGDRLAVDGISKEEARETFFNSPFAKSPLIQLDNGEKVWGFQCWWGPEDEIKTMIGDRTVNQVSLTEETTT